MDYAKSYDLELLKQTRPYEYYLQNEQEHRREKSREFDVSLSCVFQPRFENFKLYKSVGADDKTTYVIFVQGNVGLYRDAIELLLEHTESNPDLVYCDHDYMRSDGTRHTPFLKPEFSPHTLMQHNYIGGFFAVKECLLEELLGGASHKESDEKVIVYGLLLRIACGNYKITHVSETLFYYPSDEEDSEVYEHYSSIAKEDRFDEIRHFFRAEMGLIQKKRYSVSIIIPSKDHSDILIRCIDSIINKSRFYFDNNLELILVDNGSSRDEREKIERYVGSVSAFPITYLYEKQDFNYSAMCHLGATRSNKDLLLFLNDDVEVKDTVFLEKLCLFASTKSVGAVGLKLYYPNSETIQHVGVTNLDCGPTHKLATHEDNQSYYFGINKGVQNVLAVTGACLMVGREKYFQVNGFHDKMKVSYNDVDLCVNLYENGYYNVVLNDVTMYHHESLSRGSDLVNLTSLNRLEEERNCFYERHRWLKDSADPFYHRNLLQDSLDFRINVSNSYELRNKKSRVEILACKSLRISKHLQLTVEHTGWDPNATLSEPAYLIEGWGLYHKHDNRKYDRYLLMTPQEAGGETLKVELFPKFRKDLSEVFPKDRFSELSGFVARIPKDALKEDAKYRLSLLFEHKRFHTMITTELGEEYEPRN